MIGDGLHRVHAAPAAGKGGNSVDIGAVRWRGESSAGAPKREMAHRIATCWNVLEGWPTAALEAGCLREVDDAALALLSALEGETLTQEGNLARERLRAAFAARDPQQDLSGGRPADCDDCYPPKDA